VLIRLGKVLVVFALCATLGAHWALLQTVAWTSMLASNLQNGSLRQAVAETFDGNHPCCICKAIAAAKKTEQKSQLNLQTQKLDFPPVQDSFVLVAPSRAALFPHQTFSADSLSLKPPTPPPRGFFV
jgi:hypothetical protein